jgi:muconolactone delta-isomerase
VEYLVTMTTHVPGGTPDDAVDAMRDREAARARQLAAEGHLLRLWRPPVRPGEWRTLGLFAAADDAKLERELASMPLRVWRTDEPTPLSPHPNDPAARDGYVGSHRPTAGTEFLTTFTIAVPEGTPSQRVDEVRAVEARRAGELAQLGHLMRLWVLPAQPAGSQSLGLWQAEDGTEMQAVLDSLPMARWMTVETTPLSPHPSDPAISAS